jgi:hypothetical protein
MPCRFLYSAPCIFRDPQSCCSSMKTVGAAISTNTAMPSATGPNSPSSTCSPAAPVPWALAATAAPHSTVPIPTSSARVASPKLATALASRTPSSGLPNSCTSCPTVTGNISPSLSPICCSRFSTTTGPCSTTCYAVPLTPCSGTRASWTSRPASSVRYTPTDGSSISTRISTSLLPVAVSISNTASGAICFQKTAG